MCDPLCSIYGLFTCGHAFHSTYFDVFSVLYCILLCDCWHLRVFFLHSSFCWKRRGNESLMAMRGPSRRPGGNMLLVRDTFRWGKKVSKAHCFIIHLTPISSSSPEFLLFFFLFSFWSAVKQKRAAAAQPEQKLCGGLPRHGRQAWTSTVSRQERKDWLRRQNYKIWPTVQGMIWFDYFSSFFNLFMFFFYSWQYLSHFSLFAFRELGGTWFWLLNLCTWLEERRWSKGQRKVRWLRCWRGGLMWRKFWPCLSGKNCL